MFVFKAAVLGAGAMGGEIFSAFLQKRTARFRGA